MGFLLDRALTAVTRLLMVVAGVALVAMMLHVTLDVLGKYFFNAPVPLTLESVSYYYMIAVVFLPLASVERLDQHIHVELLSQHLPKAVQNLLMGVVCWLAATYFLAMTVRSWISAVRKYEIGEFIMGTYSIIIWPARFFIPVGCGLIALWLVLKGLRLIFNILPASATGERI